MSQQQAEYVTVNGVQHKVYECVACKKKIYLTKEGNDPWQKWNIDGTKHVDPQAQRKQSFKRTIAVGKLFSQNYQSVRVEIQQEFPADGDWKKQYEQVLACVDEAIAQERKKVAGSEGAEKKPQTAVASPQATGKEGRKVIKYFQDSEGKRFDLPRDHPLYEEFVNFLVQLKQDNPEIEYTAREGKQGISSFVFQNLVAGSPAEVVIDRMMLQTAEALGSQD